MEKEQAEKVLAEAAASRARQRPPLTVAGAVAKAMWIAQQPAEYRVESAELKEIMAVFLSALQRSPCYLKSVRDGIPSFTLLAYDRAGHDALRVWIGSAEANGCRQEKILDARMMLAAWERRPDIRWPT